MIKEIQAHLVKQELDGWLMADFHRRNDVAATFLKLPTHLTRRSFYFIPVKGEPTILCHAIERSKFTHLEGKLIPFSGYQQLEALLKQLLSGVKRITMEYSALGRLPYIGLVDAGTIELVRGLGIEIVTSADLVAKFLTAMSPAQMAAQKAAGVVVTETVTQAFAMISAALKADKKITEWDVCQFINEKFDAAGYETEDGPNCSVGPNAGDPHYEPTSQKSSVITKGQIVLIDLWARARNDDGVYGDITQMAFAGTKAEIDPKYVAQFKVICNARDAAVKFLKDNIGRRGVMGAEVDDVCRKVIIDAGLGEAFTHRTGHSIYATVHGPGPNIDNLETEDSRILQIGHCFSIEPGVYFKEYGMRTEINGLITTNGMEVTTVPYQNEIRPLL